MNNVIIIRYGELYLKGKNRRFFENLLINNIKHALSGIDCKMTFFRSRYEISDYTDQTEIVSRLKKVFGIHSISIAIKCKADIDEICETAKSFSIKGSFKVSTNRADKTFPYISTEVSAKAGGAILSQNRNLTVDIHNPQCVLNIDIREDGCAYLFMDKILCAGGMPVGCAGKGLLLLSGGLDSPVAGYMMAKRGLSLDAIHFHSYPYTSEKAKQKVIDLAKILSQYSGPINLTCIHFTKIQEEIHRCCTSNYMVTLVRRFMMRIAEKIAQINQCGCLINGESLGQVASQTLPSITVTNDTIKSMPVLRPCIGMDKQEIINIALKMETYETSILPYEDCCTVFLPNSPVTKPTIKRAEFEEKKLGDFSKLIEEAIETREIIKIGR